MLVLLGAFVAGVLTTLAPCVLPLLPVIVGGSLADAGRWTGPRRAILVTASLGVSVIVFSLLLKASTALLDVPAQVWGAVSGGLLIGLGVVTAFPGLWERMSAALGLAGRTTAGLAGARERGGALGAILTGAALGPVFSSCSPLYGYVVVTLLPAEPLFGLALLAMYALGLCVTLLGVALLGQRLTARMGWAIDAHGWFHRSLGAAFIAVGLLVLTGLDKALQTWILDTSPIAPWALDALFVPTP